MTDEQQDRLAVELRDYFASAAMQASYSSIYEMFLDGTLEDWPGDGIKALASNAYAVADAMMKVRDAK